jgi:hypothetical protein
MFGTGSGHDDGMFDQAKGIAFFDGAVFVADSGSDRVVRWGQPLAGGWGWQPKVDPPPLGQQPPPVQPQQPPGSPGGGVRPPGGAGGDKTAPAVSMMLPKQRFGDVRKHGLIVQLRFSEKATLTVAVRLDNRTARRLHLTRGRSAVTVATIKLRAAGARRMTVRIKLTSAAARALGRLQSVKLTVTSSATDTAGNVSAPFTRAIALR